MRNMSCFSEIDITGVEESGRKNSFSSTMFCLCIGFYPCSVGSLIDPWLMKSLADLIDKDFEVVDLCVFWCLCYTLQYRSLEKDIFEFLEHVLEYFDEFSIFFLWNNFEISHFPRNFAEFSENNFFSYFWDFEIPKKTRKFSS